MVRSEGVKKVRSRSGVVAQGVGVVADLIADADQRGVVLIANADVVVK